MDTAGNKATVQTQSNLNDKVIGKLNAFFSYWHHVPEKELRSNVRQRVKPFAHNFNFIKGL